MLDTSETLSHQLIDSLKRNNALIDTENISNAGREYY
jgi:hypothetical protein